MTLEQARAEHAVLRDIGYEMDQQDERHPSGYPADRDGVRLGIAAAEDELREALTAWDLEKRLKTRPNQFGTGKPPTPFFWKWTKTRAELMQVLGVVARLVREIDRDARERDGI